MKLVLSSLIMIVPNVYQEKIEYLLSQIVLVSLGTMQKIILNRTVLNVLIIVSNVKIRIVVLVVMLHNIEK